jgi:cytochrome c556
MKSLLVVSVVLASLGSGLVVYAQKNAPPSGRKSPPPRAEQAQKDVNAFMQLKLEHAQKLLEGVAKEDFAAIKQHAQKLGTLALDENWQVLQTREYRDYSSDFQQIAARISKEADAKNLDGATLGYVQLTLNCVDCHKHVRDEAQR